MGHMYVDTGLVAWWWIEALEIVFAALPLLQDVNLSPLWVF